MTRIGTGLGSRTRVYAATVDGFFRQLESATTSGLVPVPGSPVVLATNPARTLDSAYTQGLLIRNPDATASVYVGDASYAGVACTVSPGAAGTAWEIPAGQTQRFDVRDGTGIYLAMVAGPPAINVRVVGN